MTAGIAPQSSWILSPMAPAAALLEQRLDVVGADPLPEEAEVEREVLGGLQHARRG